MATNYRSGADFERRLKKALERHDCVRYAMRSAGSKGRVDILALRRASSMRARDAILFQCKTSGVISMDERRELAHIARDTHLTAALASKDVDRKIVIQQIDIYGEYVGPALRLGVFLHSFALWSRSCNGA